MSPVSSNTALLQLLASIEAVTAARVDRTAAADYHAALRELEAARNSEARIRGLEEDVAAIAARLASLLAMPTGAALAPWRLVEGRPASGAAASTMLREMAG